ncbi:hypothetical protein [Prevotella nigrescens]|nr:hypothetical protein [Prevotella nigrescens]
MARNLATRRKCQLDDYEVMKLKDRSARMGWAKRVLQHRNKRTQQIQTGI